MGGKTFVLSLPSQWIKRYQIRKGEELDIEERGSELVVRPDSKLLAKEIEVDFSSLHKMLHRAVGALYKAGYTKVKVHYKDKEQLQIIEKTLKRTLIGFEITQQGENYVVIELLSRLVSEGFDVTLKRFFYSLESMNQDLAQALAAKKEREDLLRKVIEKDDQNNRLADFCRRVINTGETQHLEMVSNLYYITEQLERIGDLYKMMAEHVLQSKLHCSEESVAFLRDLHMLFVQYRTLFFSFSLEGVEEFGKSFYSLKEKIKVLQQKENAESYFLFYEGVLLETIFDMNGVLLTRNV